MHTWYYNPVVVEGGCQYVNKHGLMKLAGSGSICQYNLAIGQPGNIVAGWLNSANYLSLMVVLMGLSAPPLP